MNLQPPQQFTGPRLVALAASYEDMQHADAWKDMMSRAGFARQCIVSDLLLLKHRRKNAETDDYLRAMLQGIDTVLDIPLQIRNAYNEMRSVEAKKERIAEKWGALKEAQ